MVGGWQPTTILHVASERSRAVTAKDPENAAMAEGAWRDR